MKKTHQSQIQQLLKDHKWLILVIAVFFSFSLWVISDLKHIPGPIFGGDLYRERGYTEHILRGGSVFADPTVNGEFPYFPWLGFALTALISFVTGIGTIKMLIYLPIIFDSVRGVLFYLLGLRIFKNKSLALCTTILGLGFYPIMIKISTNLAYAFSLLSLIFLFDYLEKGKRRDAVLSGLMYGAVALCHGQIFIDYSFLLFLSLLFYLVKGVWMDKVPLKKVVGENKHLITLYVVAFLVSMLFFGPLIAKYHLKVDNPVPQYALSDVNTLGVWYPLGTLRDTVYHSGSLLGYLFTALIWLGIAYCILNFKRTETSFTLFMLVAVYLAVSHYLVTIPLFNTWFEPWKLTQQYLTPQVLLVVFGLLHLQRLVRYKHMGVIAISIALFVGIWSGYPAVHGFRDNQWYQYGSQIDDFTQGLFDIGKWIETTPRDTVFLANDESSFALNAVGAAKVVFLRRVHASYFIQIDKRYADGMVMLYGKDPEKQRQLLEQYGVDYLYVDQYLLQYPIIVRKEYADYLQENGVNFTEQMVRFDPSTAEARQFDALVVPPQNLTVMDLATQAKVFYAAGQPISIMYALHP